MVKIKLLLLGLFLYSSLWAQEEAPYHLFFSTYFQLGFPQEALQRNLDRAGIGGGGLVLFQVKRLPVFAGVEITFMNLDSESETYSDNTEWTTRSNLFLGNGVIRFQPFVDFPVYPYFDALFGMKNFYTRTAIKYLDTDETDSSSDGSDWALSYGLAVGAQMAVFRNPAITLDIRCSYSQGNNATYFARNPNAVGPYNDPIEAFQQRTTPTPVIIPQIGVTLNLNHPYFKDLTE